MNTYKKSRTTRADEIYKTHFSSDVRNWIIFPLTNPMEQSAYWEFNNHSASQEISSFLLNMKVHCHVHKNPLLVPSLSQMDPVHTFPTHSLRSILILSSHLRLGLPSGIFTSGIPFKILYKFLISPVHACMSHISHHYCFDHHNNI